MNASNNGSLYYMCQVCSHSVLVPPNVRDGIACDRCGWSGRIRPKSAQLTLSCALTALILYIPANIYPFMTIELYGRRNSSTILGGIGDLFAAGSYFIGGVIFLASVVIPLLKLLILFYLSLNANRKNSLFKTRLYHIVEAIGRWSMLDIFLLAVLVAVMKLGPWSTVQPELGSLLFALVVIFTMIASAYFDPKLLWESDDQDLA
jgi:paraquat-inducible protein A